MEITRHARPPTVSTAAKDKVVCSTPRRKRKVAASRRASRVGQVVGNVAERTERSQKANIGRRVLAIPLEQDTNSRWFPWRRHQMDEPKKVTVSIKLTSPGT